MMTNVVGNNYIIGIKLNKNHDYSYFCDIRLLENCDYFYDVICNENNTRFVELSTCIPDIINVVSLSELIEWVNRHNHKIVYE